MKLENFEEVRRLVNTKTTIEKAIQQCKEYEVSDQPDSGGGVGVAELGYYGTFAKHSDGSGDVVDLNGCYVETEVVRAIELVLWDKRLHILDRLAKLDVDVSVNN